MKNFLKSAVAGMILAASVQAGPFDLDARNIRLNDLYGTVRIDEFSSHTYVPAHFNESDYCGSIELNGALWQCKDKFRDGEREGRITRMYMRDDNNDDTVDFVYQERSYFISRGSIGINIPSLKIDMYRSQMNDEGKKMYDNLYKDIKSQLRGR